MQVRLVSSGPSAPDICGVERDCFPFPVEVFLLSDMEDLQPQDYRQPD
jgi:hypothetical protein